MKTPKRDNQDSGLMKLIHKYTETMTGHWEQRVALHDAIIRWAVRKAPKKFVIDGIHTRAIAENGFNNGVDAYKRRLRGDR